MDSVAPPTEFGIDLTREEAGIAASDINVKIAFIEEGIKHADEFFEILHLVQEEVIIAAVFCFLVDVGQEFPATDQAALLVSLPRFLFFTELVKEENVFLVIKGETDDVLRIYSSL